MPEVQMEAISALIGWLGLGSVGMMVLVGFCWWAINQAFPHS